MTTLNLTKLYESDMQSFILILKLKYNFFNLYVSDSDIKWLILSQFGFAKLRYPLLPLSGFLDEPLHLEVKFVKNT